jgi:hypothetical protein
MEHLTALVFFVALVGLAVLALYSGWWPFGISTF